MEKMTKRDYFNAIRARVADDVNLVAFIDHELELLNRKNVNRSTAPTKAQKENAALAELVYAAMEPGHAYTVSEIMKTVPELNGASNQKATAILRGLKRAELITRTEEKGKAYFIRN